MRSPSSRTESQLPRYLTSFVGRDDDIVEITDLLMREDVQLLTLVGPGGGGKTRLAIETVTRFDPDGWDDVWFVPLVAVRDPALVLPAIAQALGLQLAAGHTAAEAIAHVLRGRRTLLVIDNLEHVAEAAQDLGHILRACPAVTMLVTSRVALRISGEYRYTVDPLPMPIPGDVRARSLEDVESVRLFLDRANSSGRPVVLGEDNAADISAICRRLDGLPLALELAAARCNMLSPAALDAFLEQGSGLLSNGPRDVPERHRSMYDTIAWSYNLLTDDEQAVFRRLAVFSGGFSLAAAGAVIDLPVDILDIVSSLVAMSLLIPLPSDTSDPRFTMLQTLREFGQERLKESGEASHVRDRHAAWFLHIAEASDFAWCMPLEDGLARIHRLQVEQGNVRAALQWLHTSGKVAACLTMASKLGTFWVVLGNSAEGQRWLETLLAMPGLDNARDRAKGLAILSWIANQHGNNMKAFELAEEGLSLFRTHDDPIGVIQCLVLSGVAASRIPHLGDTAIARHHEAIACMEALREPTWIVNWILGELQQLGQIALLDGDLDRAASIFGEAWDHVQGKGAHFLYGNGLLLWSAHLARMQGDDTSALRTYQQTLELAHDGFHIKACAAAIAGVAGALAGLGQVEASARMFGASEALHEMYGIPFIEETFDLQRALRLPEPWAREQEPFGAAQRLRDARKALDTHPLPAVRDISRLESAWAEGRQIAFETAIREALAATPESAPETSTRFNLTLREFEVLQLLAEGKTNRSIADTLSISERTIEHHVAHILAKLDLDSRTAAATFAIRNDLL